MRLRSARAAAITCAMAKRMTARDDRPALGATVGDTAAKLVAAAAKEFKRHGFHGTDSNKIARRAGFAPQTFYRWFRDKTEIFLAVYRAWEDEEREVVGGLLAEQAPDERLVDAIVAHHRAYRLFRRSLRQLSLEDAVVRKARAESRLRQIERIRRAAGPEVGSTADIAAILLQIERLSDAVAEGELIDLGVGDEAARAALGALLARLRR
jgi:AcrR family transcriptional regulator